VGINYDSSNNITGQVGIDVSTNVTVVGTVTGNPSTGSITGGIMVTFNREPSAEVVEKLKSGNFRSVLTSGKAVSWTWWTERWDYRDQAQGKAIEAALGAGGTLKGM
jgi:hypothetical protein